jgi:hypothetical protein
LRIENTSATAPECLRAPWAANTKPNAAPMAVARSRARSGVAGGRAPRSEAGEFAE